MELLVGVALLFDLVADEREVDTLLCLEEVL